MRVTGRRLADELEGASVLTRIANQIFTKTGDGSDDELFVRENERRLREKPDW